LIRFWFYRAKKVSNQSQRTAVKSSRQKVKEHQWNQCDYMIIKAGKKSLENA
jgi:hypothetical protein